MSFYIVASMCIIFLGIEGVNLLENILISSDRKKMFYELAGLIAFEIVLDTVAFALDGVATCKECYKVIKIIEFSISPLLPTILSKIITRQNYWDKYKIAFGILITINLMAQLATFFVPIMFVITEDAVYVRTLIGYFYLVILAVCICLLICSTKYAFLQNNRSSNAALILTVVFIVAGVILRLIIDKCNSDWLAITFSLFVFRSYFSDESAKVDRMTTLLNRNAFDDKLSRITFSTAIIMIDMNNLKYINDTCMHEKGDWALAKTAEAIYSVFGKRGWCYRVGGDEFCVILKPGIVKKPNQDYIYRNRHKTIEEWIELLDRRIEKMSEECEKDEEKKVLIYGVAQGYATFYSLEEDPNENHKTIYEIYKLADERMYKNKAEKKEHRQD